ncbi:MAG TPA: DUF3472 domain-containing protein [Puia sp.]|nr:DUF3472 domain-containing protein [Puia sp.]
MKTFCTVLFFFTKALTGAAQISTDSIVIPLEGNSWSISANSRVVYFRLNHTGTIRATTGPYYISTYHIKDTGYQNLTLTGRDVETITITGEATRDANFVPNNEGNFFYWGRRGPSVHLNYPLPEGSNAEWFYNEVFVPSGQDVEGSYFMADGFSQGYFGMQVNSPTERHILFSLWSPFQTDDPKKIPDSQKIVLLAKGPNVHAGEFGNEGSGGQSYLNYSWRAGNTYRFLVHAQPQEHNTTVFTAWFFAPEEGKWRLIASFRRPQTHTWLTGLHSFLENFEPATGNKTRLVLFDHQWIRTDQGKWVPLTKARFTGDNTARKGYRMDYAGGIKGTAFYLQNCGFFSDYTPLDSWWERHPGPNETPPVIDLDHLGK